MSEYDCDSEIDKAFQAMHDAIKATIENETIAALTAERDELRRKVEAVEDYMIDQTYDFPSLFREPTELRVFPTRQEAIDAMWTSLITPEPSEQAKEEQ